ncbi:hypothetical protein IFVP408_C2210023 [Vibrio parahaemolyticus]
MFLTLEFLMIRFFIQSIHTCSKLSKVWYTFYTMQGIGVLIQHIVVLLQCMVVFTNSQRNDR